MACESTCTVAFSHGTSLPLNQMNLVAGMGMGDSLGRRRGGTLPL